MLDAALAGDAAIEMYRDRDAGEQQEPEYDRGPAQLQQKAYDIRNRVAIHRRNLSMSSISAVIISELPLGSTSRSRHRSLPPSTGARLGVKCEAVIVSMRRLHY